MHDSRPVPASGPGVRRPELPRPRAVTVNGVTIPRAEIAREVQHHPAAKPVEAWLAAAEALVVRELLLQEARRLAIPATPETDDEGRRETDEEALVRTLVAQEVVTPEADDAACRRWYEQNRQRFRSADLYAVRHILCAAPPDDTAARREASARAQAIAAAVVDDPSAFAALAEAHSACPSRAMGGNLGQISRGQTVPEFEAALAGLAVGVPSPEPIETRYGYHVVMVDRRLAGGALPYEAVRARLGAWLTDSARRTAIRQYIAMLAGRATITGIEIGAAHATPVR